jgi:hypothetical protein
MTLGHVPGIADAYAVDDAKDIRDLALAWERYSRQAKSTAAQRPRRARHRRSMLPATSLQEILCEQQADRGLGDRVRPSGALGDRNGIHTRSPKPWA